MVQGETDIHLASEDLPSFRQRLPSAGIGGSPTETALLVTDTFLSSPLTKTKEWTSLSLGESSLRWNVRLEGGCLGATELHSIWG